MVVVGGEGRGGACVRVLVVEMDVVVVVVCVYMCVNYPVPTSTKTDLISLMDPGMYIDVVSGTKTSLPLLAGSEMVLSASSECPKRDWAILRFP